MANFFKRRMSWVNTRMGFFLLTIGLFWVKTYIAYQTEFTLGAKGSVQQFLLLINPLPAALLVFGIALYFRGRLAYWLMMIINV
ncbi:glycerol phosphate lipoteichoic acid synthase, partial [Lacticaseibacillus paracasei]|nr:glycerol phosphate lipoteichoic acid synthase [Lacticaseibacillus paracasei]